MSSARTNRTAGLALMVVLLASCGGGKSTAHKKAVEKTPISDFAAASVIAVPGNAETNAKAAEESKKVIGVLNTYYNAAFLDPKKWVNGTHPELAGLFSAEAQPGLTANMGALALAELAPKMAKVKPTKQEASKISIDFQDDGSSPFSIVNAVFEGDGTARSKSDGTVKLVHTVTFWLEKQGDAYKIMAYTVELKADTAVKKAAFGVPPPVGVDS